MADRPSPAYDGDDPYVFVSYSHEDRDDVYAEIRCLQDQGINVWYDTGISVGSEWSEAIAQAIKHASHFIYFITPRSADSENCRRELNFANEEQVSILAVHLEETEVPDGLRLNLNNRQALFRHNDPDYRTSLTRALGRSGRPTPPTQAVRSRSLSRRRMALIAPAVAVGVLIAWQGWDRTPARPPATSIAVLPFEDMSPGGDQQWLANGMAEELAFYLARIDALRVADARAANISDVKEVGEALTVGSVVLGSVRRSGDDLRVTARLIDTTDGTQLWSARYDSDLQDVFDVQREIAQSIVKAIEAELDVEMTPGMVEAYDNARFGARDVRAYELWRKALEIKFYRQGLPSEEEWRQALQYNLQAVAIDPDFAQGHVGVADSYWTLFRAFSHDPGDLESAKVALDRALELNDQNVFAIGYRAQMAASEEQWDVVAGVVETAVPRTRILESEGVFAVYITALVNLGRWEDANAAVEKASAFVGRFPDRYGPDRFTHAELALGLFLVRRDWEGIIEQLELAHEADAAWMWGTWGFLVEAYLGAGRELDALAVRLKYLDEHHRETARRGYAEGGWLEMLRQLARSREAGGEYCITPVPGPYRPSAALYAEIGETEQMYSCLEEAEGAEVSFWPSRQYDLYRSEPRFQALLDRHHIVGYKSCCPWSRPAKGV